MKFIKNSITFFQKFLKIKITQNIILKFRDKKVLNSFISSILRLFFRSQFLFRLYSKLKNSIDPKYLNKFWIIHIGFVKRRNYLPFLKLDPYLSNKPHICSDLRNFPFGFDSCQEIYIKHFFKYFHKKLLKKYIKSWNNILIPGGILKIQTKMRNNRKHIENLKKLLNQNQFYIKNINTFDLKINGNLTITAVKQRNINSIPSSISNKKLNDLFLILKENHELFSNLNKVCILGYQSQVFKKFLKNLNLNNYKIHNFDSINSLSTISDNYFDCSIIVNFFEYYNYSFYFETFNELRRILKPNADILIIIPEKKNYQMKESAHFFDKGIITRIIDEYNFEIEWINLSSSFKLIQILIKNQYANPLLKKNIKIILLGNYYLRYSYLNNAWWDSQARAFEKIGYNTLILDFKEYSFNYLLKRIQLYNPEILLIAGKTAIDFLKKFANFFRFSKIKVVYWLWDVRIPIKFNFKNIIDYMFISSKGEIPLYKKSYNIDKIYFMPTPVVPQILHRNKKIKEEFEIGFSGILDYTMYHKKRTQVIKLLNKHFNVKIFKNIYNNLPEFYSKCKIIFGGAPDLKNLELYSSNRMYIALSCGSCYITNYFKGLEKLAENEKNILWYHNIDELIHLIKKYLANKNLRFKIKEKAEELAKLKHNYIDRIKNLIDIINNRTEEFYGFINKTSIC